MSILGREVEVLTNLREIIDSLNEVQNLKCRTDDIKEKLNLIERERKIILEYQGQLELLHSIVRELYSRRTTRAFDNEVVALMQNLVVIIRDLQDYANILQTEIETQRLNIGGENNSLRKLTSAFNLESVETNELLRKLDSLGGEQEVNAYRRIEGLLRRFQESWFSVRRIFMIKPIARLCVVVALFGAVACGDSNVVEAPRAPQQEQVSRDHEIIRARQQEQVSRDHEIIRARQHEQVSQNYQIVQQVNQVQLEEFSRFRPKKILIYCANQGEKVAVIQTLKDRNQMRKSTAKFKIKDVNGISIIDDWAVKDSSGRIEYVKVNIVVQGQTIPTVSEGYQLITLRGHTQDMMPLFEDTQKYEASKVLYLLGGCESVQFIPQIITTTRAVIADNYIGESANNTYLLIRVVDLSRKVDTWDSLSRTILSNSDRAQLRTYFPGMEYTTQLLHP